MKQKACAMFKMTHGCLKHSNMMCKYLTETWRVLTNLWERFISGTPNYTLCKFNFSCFDAEWTYVSAFEPL